MPHGYVHRALYTLAALVAVGICVAAAALLWVDRRGTWDAAYVASRNLADGLAGAIGRTLHVYDLSLQGVIERLHEPGVALLAPQTLHRFLFDRSASAEYLGTILVLDSDGLVRYDSASIAPPLTSFADRDFFRVHRDADDVGMYLSRPYRSRLRGGDESLAVSRRLSNPDGSFAGVVVGTLRLAYFRDRFAGLSIGERDVITVFRNDGAVLARDPYSMSDLGDDLAMSPAFQQFLIRREGAFVGMLSPDGVRRLYTFDSVEGTPVVVAVALAVDEVLQPWVRRAMLIVPVTIALSAAMLALMLLYRREMARRGEVERRLEAQAHTDGLTGISNRRLFDEVLEREWQSALRERAPLSLLFVDADHFKRYNDRYGHQEGDALLRRLAQAIRQKARRPRDLAARYGGEEFVLLLPRTEGRQALAIAERLRKSVAALRLPHQDNGGGIVTLSIGVASALPEPGQAAASLVEAADAAVYRAKEAGRNRVVMAGR